GRPGRSPPSCHFRPRVMSTSRRDLWQNPWPKASGQTTVVDNRPGAGGNIGNEAVAHATPDGYTVLFTQGGIAVNQFLYKNLKYDEARDLIPVSLLVLVQK